jgi:hypothetical protein
VQIIRIDYSRWGAVLTACRYYSSLSVPHHVFFTFQRRRLTQKLFPQINTKTRKNLKDQPLEKSGIDNLLLVKFIEAFLFLKRNYFYKLMINRIYNLPETE